MQVQASTTKTNGDGKKVKDRSVTVEINIPETLAELTSEFGENVIAAAAIDSLVISAQAKMRSLMSPVTNKKGEVTREAFSDEAIAVSMQAWRPDVKQVVRQTAFEKASGALDKLSLDERKALLERLRAMA